VEWERVLTGTGKGEKIVVFRHLRNIAKKKATIIYVMSVRLSVPWKKNSAFTVRIFVKFYIWGLNGKICRENSS